jgi:mannose-6-phosphate isomerase-like protein (cupin superfamily)
MVVSHSSHGSATSLARARHALRGPRPLLHLEPTYQHAKAQTWKVNNVMAPNDRYKTAVTTIAPQSGVVSGLEHVIGVE